MFSYDLSELLPKEKELLEELFVLIHDALTYSIGGSEDPAADADRIENETVRLGNLIGQSPLAKAAAIGASSALSGIVHMIAQDSINNNRRVLH